MYKQWSQNVNVAHSEEGTWALEWHQVQHTGGDWQYQPQPGNASHLQHLRASCFSLASYFYYKVQPSALSIFIGRNFRWIMGLTRTKNTGKHLPNIKGLPCWHSGVLPNYINLQFYISESISEHNRKPKTFMLLGFLWSFHFLTCQIKAPKTFWRVLNHQGKIISLPEAHQRAMVWQHNWS